MKSLTIEQLSEKLNGKLWIKEDKKRIYLERGYNTKKMSTKTYVYQREDGSFGVSCYIDCPSQAFQWIKSQQQEVIDGVESAIEDAMVDTYYIVMDNATGKSIDSDLKQIPLNDYYVNKFNNQPSAENFIKEEKLKNASVKVWNRDEFDKEVERLDEIKNQQAGLKNTETPEYGVNTKIAHGKFGEGVVVAESDSVVEINFESAGTKQLYKAFAKLQKL